MKKSNPAEATVYLYGVCGLPVSEKLCGTGVGEPPAEVHLISREALAAIVSAAPDPSGWSSSGRSLRQAIAAHDAVINRFAECVTVLPAGFGVVCSRQFVEKELLGVAYEALLTLLHELEGAAELKVKALYEEESLLRDVVAAMPRLASAGGATYADRIDRGKAIADAVELRQRADEEKIIRKLQSVARDIVTRPCGALEAVNASVLIQKNDLQKFDALLEKIQREAQPLIQLRCVGPLPPYSFVKNLYPSPQSIWA